jgi:threonine synthase
LELFHGPSLAFKDFGARFMARLMGYFNKIEKERLIILVATSGDTGGAVASGFYKTPGIEVVILYPSGKVSPFQEKQLTTLGHNITALEIEGTFDDCQAIVKRAFLDKELNKQLRLSSANSINIARLIPQSLYYFEAFKQLQIAGNTLPVIFSVPSGNFGNLTAGILAKRMGLNISHMIAATNVNDVIPKYLETGSYKPKVSVRTISNAMDVGNPSNFARLENLYSDEECNTCDMMGKEIKGYSFSDDKTKEALKYVFEQHQYLMDPHGAIGYLALKEYQRENPETMGVILETAHPSKFIGDVEKILGSKIEIPHRLAKLENLPKSSLKMSTDYSEFKEWISSHVF